MPSLELRCQWQPATFVFELLLFGWTARAVTKDTYRHQFDVRYDTASRYVLAADMDFARHRRF